LILGIIVLSAIPISIFGVINALVYIVYGLAELLEWAVGLVTGKDFSKQGDKAPMTAKSNDSDEQ